MHKQFFVAAKILAATLEASFPLISAYLSPKYETWYISGLDNEVTTSSSVHTPSSSTSTSPSSIQTTPPSSSKLVSFSPMPRSQRKMFHDVRYNLS